MASAGLASTIVLGRLLEPAAFGLAAMAMVLTGFFSTFGDLGLSQAIMRKGVVEPEEVSFLFWLNLLLTAVWALLIAVAAPSAALLFGDAQVRDVLWGCLPAFLITGAVLQHQALLQRRLRFAALAVVSISAALCGLAAGIAVAWMTRSVWAIVAAGLAQAVVSASLTLALARWRPGPFRRIAGAGELFRFGANASAFSLLNFASASLPALLLGPVAGPSVLGQFNRAQALFALPLNNFLQPLAQAALPVMTRLRPTPQLYRQAYLQLVQRLSCALAPGAAVLAVLAPDLVRVLLGPGWNEAGLVLAILAPALAAYGLNWPTTDLLVSQNRARDLRLQGLCDVILRGLGVICGLPGGAPGVALGYAAGTLLTSPVRVWLAGRTGPVSARDQWEAAAPALPLALGALAGALAGRAGGQLLAGGALQTLMLGAVGALLGFGAAAMSSANSRRALAGLFGALFGRASPGAS